jgi:hypothetical protein
MEPMTTTSIAARLIAKLGGPYAAAKLLDEPDLKPEIARWVRRGFVGPRHLDKLEPHLPPGITRAKLVKEIAANSPGLQLAEEQRLQRIEKLKARLTYYERIVRRLRGDLTREQSKRLFG